MSIEEAIKLGEKANADMKVKKEEARIATLSPEEKKQEEEKKSLAKKTEQEKAILTKPESELTEEEKAKKSAVIENQKKAQEAEDEKLLQSKDEELDESQAEKKATLIKSREKKKEAEKQANIQRRIDEISSELKAERHARVEDKKKIEDLESQLSALRDAKEPSKIAEQVEKLEQERIAQYLKSDANLPRDKKREMSDEEIQEWFADDMVGCQRWLARQENRRERERISDTQKLSSPAKKNDVFSRQRESSVRASAKHPELFIDNRVKELKAENKSDDEIMRIIFKENKKVKIMTSILNEKPAYLNQDNAPELLVEEMEKRLKVEENKESQEDRDQRIAQEAAEAERKRLSQIDTGLNSTRGKEAETKMTGLEKEQWAIYKKQFPNKTLDDFKAMHLRRKQRAGV